MRHQFEKSSICAAASRNNRPAAICSLSSEKASLTWTVLDHLLNLGLYSFKVERSRSLHRRKLDSRRRQFCDVLLDHHEPPELSGVKVVHVSARQVIQALAANGRRALERILTDVDHHRHVGCGLFTRPAIRLLVE